MNSWDELALFEIRDLAEDFYRDAHGGNLNAGKYKEIKTNLQQGRSYFSSAKNAAELVRPVLIYYGVLSLSRAAILFMNPELRESSLKPGHGVSTVNWQNSLTGNSINYEDLSVKFTSGTFMEFLVNGGNTEYFEIESTVYGGESKKAFNTATQTLEQGCLLKLSDLLARIPDLEEMYRKVYGTESITFNVIVRESELGIVDNGRMFGYTNVSDITDKGIPGILREEGKVLKLSSSYKEGEEQEGLPFISTAWTGTLITHPFECSGKFINISYIGKLYLASYFVGMLARYFPTSWMCLIGKGRGAKIYPVIQDMLKVIEMKYSEKIVKLLKNKMA